MTFDTTPWDLSVGSNERDSSIALFEQRREMYRKAGRHPIPDAYLQVGTTPNIDLPTAFTAPRCGPMPTPTQWWRRPVRRRRR
jgi:hypothetical protein